MRRDDWLVHQLPVGLLDDDFLARFTRLFQHMADTVWHQVDTLPHMFDTAVAPEPMVRAMGAWIGVDWIDPSLPSALQRAIVRRYAALLPWRGTARGLRQLLELVSGQEAIVRDSGGVFVEGEAPPRPPHVYMAVASSGWATPQDLLAIVRSELPAAVTFQLVVGGRTVWPPTPDDGPARTTPAWVA